MANYLDYSHPIARIRVLENKLINKNQIERLVDSKDTKTFFEVLADTAYSDHFDITNNPNLFQQIINAEILKTVNFLKKNNPYPDQLDWLWLKYDILNLKFTLKNKLINNEISEKDLSPLGCIAVKDIVKAVYEVDKFKLDTEYQEIIEKAKKIYEKNNDPKLIDLYIDKAYFTLLESKTKKIKSKIIKNFIKSKIDLYNFKLLLRFKNQQSDKKIFIKYIATNGHINQKEIIEAYNHDLDALKSNIVFFNYQKMLSLSVDYFKKYNSFILFEKLSYDYLIDQIRFAKYEPFGPEPLVGYFIAKDNEAKLLRIIMISKINNIESTLIHQQLRKLYLERQ